MFKDTVKNLYLHKWCLATIFVIFLFLASPFTAVASNGHSVRTNNLTGSLIKNGNGLYTVDQSISNNKMVQLPYRIHNTDNARTTGPYTGMMTVMVSFKLSNRTELNQYLTNLSEFNNPEYHHYMSRADFTAKFSPSETLYSNAVNYFSKFPSTRVTTFSDRVSIVIKAPSRVIEKIFNVSIENYRMNNIEFYSTDNKPALPSYIGQSIDYISGLSNQSSIQLNSYPAGGMRRFNEKQLLKSNNIITSGGFPQPVTSGGVQNIYGSDLQVAYDEQTLLNTTYPTNEVIATILWSGSNSSGTPVGPFYPSDIYAYYNATLPSYEPHAKVYGVPINGAPEPGVSATYDATGANGENTLDLEMVGSTAPGASVFNVYGPNATITNLNEAFAYILNPNASFPQLNKVSVITNSWGGPEYNNTVWYTYLQEAQARGITVLASSGDSGDNPSSSKYTPNPNYPSDYVQFPSAMAYNSFGVTAVGGTTLTLSSNLQIFNQTAWYISASDSADGGPAGSTGGISQVFPEPVWQLNTEANNTLQGHGRGVPDIAAIGNNTIIYISINGSGKGIAEGGTSVASPVEAGIVAEMDAILNLNAQPNLGYLNPLIYPLANQQVAPQTTTSTTGFYQTGVYNSTLPTLPFYNVMYGRNHVYNAYYGYNLVTGWGSIDAYNFTMYVLNVNYNNSIGALSGVMNQLNLTALNVTSYYPNGTVNINFNASIQQNFFIANSMGMPIYWIQNVIYIYGTPAKGYNMWYTGWVVYPFYWLYPSDVIYEYNFPAGKLVTLPHSFRIASWLSNLNTFNKQTMNFEVNSQVITLLVPGSSYIIGLLNYSYLWQGSVISNGPYPNNPYPGGLAPQFGVVGGPSLGNGNFYVPTYGNMTPYLMPMGSSQFTKAPSMTYSYSVDQTGESATNLAWVKQSNGAWNITTSAGSTEQGVLSYISQTDYKVTFTESGLPAGTIWYVNITGGKSYSSTTGTITFSEPNGTYTYTVASEDKAYSPNPATGSFTVNGVNTSKSITFSLLSSAYTATFTDSRLPSGTKWYVNITGGASYSSATTTITFTELNGTYTYTVATGDKAYSPNPATGSFTVNGANVSRTISFNLVTYSVTLTESGLPPGTNWSVTLNGVTEQSTASSIVFTEPNGTYAYTVSNVSVYSATPSPGSVTVNGKNASVSVIFKQVMYSVTLTESGLPLGTNWSVTLNGVTEHSTASSIVFTEPNGTYAYFIGYVTGYATSFVSGSVTVNGKAVTLTISFTSTSTSTNTPTAVSSYVYYIIIVVVIIIVVIAAIILMKKKGKSSGASMGANNASYTQSTMQNGMGGGQFPPQPPV
ncbi:MAG: protease pro-enzyme activation domain-containing protein [Candidatus Thermoplasmatota archaeon]|nr:protease pro-enzyme activation domain-containing protein [Candidatus Thermoplasmatota archaeon]